MGTPRSLMIRPTLGVCLFPSWSKEKNWFHGSLRLHSGCRCQHKTRQKSLSESCLVLVEEELWTLMASQVRRLQCGSTHGKEHHDCQKIYIRIRRHGSCIGSWDTYGCLYTDPETWILQRSLRYKIAKTWAQKRGSCRGSILVDAAAWIRRHGSYKESWDIKLLRLRRHGSCRGSWDINGC